MTSRQETARYRFGPLEKRGFIAGWRAGQVGIVALGLAIAVGVLRSVRPPLDLVAALGVVLASLAAASWPVAARTCDQWCPVVAAWVARVACGRHRHTCPVPVLGRPASVGPAHPAPEDPGRTDNHPGRSHRGVGHRPQNRVPGGRSSLPAPLSGCRLLAPPVPVGGLRLGVIHDGRARTYTGVLAVSGAAFALLEQEERHRRVAAWSSLLASLARESSPIHRLQWLGRDLPGGQLSGPAERWPSKLAIPPEAPAARSYAEVVQRAGMLARSHQVLLALSIRADRSTREVRAFGGGDQGACALLARELRSLQAGLVEAEVLVQGALSPQMLMLALRQAYESSVAAPGWAGAPARNGSPAMAGAPARNGSPAMAGAPARNEPPAHSEPPAIQQPPGWPWPLASSTTWSTLRTDSTWHATYWVAEWPRVDVGPDFLAPLLLHSGVRHTMAVTMEPISPLKAARDVQQARTADLADAELRRRGGFLTSARRGREAAAVTRREVELADGHAEYRFSGYVTVTANSSEALDADCLRMEQAAGQARLELRRLYGQQDEAFTWTLPMGRGLG